MQLTSHLMMLMMAVAVCSAGLLPNMMFASRGRIGQPHSQYQQQQQPQHWRPSGLGGNPWDDGTETYGYLADRHPNMIDDYTTSFQQNPLTPKQQQPMVYGVPHRYLGEPNYVSPGTAVENELYSNGLLLRSRAPYKRSSFAPFYDSQDDYMADEVDIPEDYYDRPVSRQDVINFEKYVQRFFQQPANAAVSDEELSVEPERQYTADDWSSYNEDADPIDESAMMTNNYESDDDEATRQLHLLLNKQQQRRPIVALREIQKKSVPVPATTVTTTAKPEFSKLPSSVTTTSTTTPSPATFGQRHHQGQKEEPLLRPPTPLRQLVAVTSTLAPTKVEHDDKEDTSIYHTIQRLMNMRDELQVNLKTSVSIRGIVFSCCLDEE